MTSVCDTCKLPIEGRSICALEKTYHPNHFVCGVCEKPITDSIFHEREGKPLCQKDYEASCPICTNCSKPILENRVIANDKYYHAEHFLCKMCKGQLAGERYHDVAGEFVCHSCFVVKVADKCKGCGEPIIENATLALNAKWHPDCFKCKMCNKVINAKTFRVTSTGEPICSGC